MKSTAAKSIQVLLALFILAAALAPACTGAENCSMPCCRHEAKPVPHPAGMASAGACCAPTADDSADNLSGCRFANISPVLPSGVERTPVMTAAVSTAVFDDPIERPVFTPPLRFMDSSPSDTPLYLRLQTLLI
ncbi:MAG: hypothetical protein MUC57_12015 [Desulfobacterales bacterium]|jgi:hypothetical protein|nr:hypothetical protein [Desulfobacterales bacterium]